MRFLSMIRINEKNNAKVTDKLMADMGKLMEEMTRAGQLVTTAGLRPTSEGVRVRLSGGKLTAMDGPFTETKEVIGGFAMLEAPSKAEALELVNRFLLVHGPEWEVECELRALDGPDFGEDQRCRGGATEMSDSKLEPHPNPKDPKHEEWVVDEADEESFPASDPSTATQPKPKRKS